MTQHTDHRATEPLTHNQRLDCLPLTKKHKKMLLGSGIGWALDAMDVGLISFIMAALTVQWGLTTTETGWLASVGFIGMAVGATFGGLLADKFGRRHVFAITLLVYGLATGASALATGLIMLLILRFIVGLGLGAELPVASTLISEFAPRRIRGRMVVALEAFWAVGWIAAALIGAFVVSASPNGWRWALALGCIPAIYGLIVRFKLPESVRFYDAQGKHDKAEKIVRNFEKDVPPAQLAQAQEQERNYLAQTETQDHVTSETVHSIWAKPLRARTLALWIIWFCINLSYYGAFVWIPSLLVADGFSMVKSFQFTLIITLAQLPGYLAAAWLIEVWGRRVTLGVFLAGSAVAAALYGFADSPTTIILAGCLLSFFNLGAWGALYAIGPELYPTSVRAAGTGAAAGFGRIASIISPLIVPPLLAVSGNVALFALFGAAFALAALAAFTLPEQKAKVLD